MTRQVATTCGAWTKTRSLGKRNLHRQRESKYGLTAVRWEKRDERQCNEREGQGREEGKDLKNVFLKDIISHRWVSGEYLNHLLSFLMWRQTNNMLSFGRSVKIIKSKSWNFKMKGILKINNFVLQMKNWKHRVLLKIPSQTLKVRGSVETVLHQLI